jgi:hypothetical protein
VLSWGLLRLGSSALSFLLLDASIPGAFAFRFYLPCYECHDTMPPHLVRAAVAAVEADLIMTFAPHIPSGRHAARLGSLMTTPMRPMRNDVAVQGGVHCRGVVA